MRAANHVVAFNAGSSSLKVEAFCAEPWRSHVTARVEGIGQRQPVLRFDRERSESVDATTHARAAELVLERFSTESEIAPDGGNVLATGHRIVHGGDSFSAPVVATPDVMKPLSELAHEAPLHNPAALSVLRLVAARWPLTTAVAVFDTAFFRELPEYVRAYAVPAAWRQELRIQRYGFHGIAHEYLYRRCKALATTNGARRVVTLQLGQGCSAAAIRDGCPVETSMGFTPLEGLIMATRPGDLDVGAVLSLLRRGHSWAALEGALNRESGLLGLSGDSGDVRELLDLEAKGADGASLALAAFCHRINKYIGAYASVLGGFDTLAFGGGIGENSPIIRSRVCAALSWLGLELDEEANARCIGDEQRISKTSSSVQVYVIPVREEEAIARSALSSVVNIAGGATPLNGR